MSDTDDAPNLKAMTREELNDHAGGLGMADAAEYATKADLIAAIEAHAAEAATAAEPEADAEPATAGARYRVLKAFTDDDDGHTAMPGDVVEATADWPHRRAKQLVDLKYLEPLKGDADGGD